MRKQIVSLLIGFSILVAGGCGEEKPQPAKSTPALTPEAEEAMKKATTGGGGPEMVRKKMEEQQQQQSKPQ